MDRGGDAVCVTTLLLERDYGPFFPAGATSPPRPSREPFPARYSGDARRYYTPSNGARIAVS
jgi:hypothetical protein